MHDFHVLSQATGHDISQKIHPVEGESRSSTTPPAAELPSRISPLKATEQTVDRTESKKKKGARRTFTDEQVRSITKNRTVKHQNLDLGKSADNTIK